MPTRLKKNVRKDRRQMTIGDWGKWGGIAIAFIGAYGVQMASQADTNRRVLTLEQRDTAVATLLADNTDTKRRITTMESRQQEDREATQRSIGRVEQKTEKIDENVQKLLRLMEANEAVRQNERRTDRREERRSAGGR